MKKDILLNVTAFISGAAVMIFEIVGSRVVAPHLGTSTYVWTSLIGVVLASLSFGYWYGGILADRKVNLFLLSKIIFIAAIGVFWVVVFGDVIVLFSLSLLSDLMYSSFVSSCLLFAPASIALGMVSPLLAKMKIISLDSSGRSIGNLYSLSTLGSIVGTFLTGYFLIPFLGTSNILMLLVFVLVILSVVIAPKRLGVIFPILIFVFLLFQWTSFVEAKKDMGVIDIDTVYNRIFVLDTYQGDEVIREMRINNEHSSALKIGSDELVYEYTKYFRLADFINPSITHALMIGGAGYSYPKDFLQKHSTALLDVVEIDSGVTDVAKKYFGLTDDERLTIYHEDARAFLSSTDRVYDVIYGDVFKSSSIPFHITTVEFIQLVSDSLTDDGIFILNTITTLAGETSRFFAAEYHTLKSIFPYVYVFTIQNIGHEESIQNVMLVGTKKEITNFDSDDFQMQKILNHQWVGEVPPARILRDDYAPVEYYMRAKKF